MAKYSEDTLSSWTKPPSETEKTKLENSERMVREGDCKLNCVTSLRGKNN